MLSGVRVCERKRETVVVRGAEEAKIEDERPRLYVEPSQSMTRFGLFVDTHTHTHTHTHP